VSTFNTNPWDIDQLLSMMDSRKIVLPGELQGEHRYRLPRRARDPDCRR